ncbi:MAG: DUF805 domain-containing protein [Burkholderiales bacterium]|nr:DUF805 domain-containing protein [Burkholderiales bacterium]
MTFFDAIKTCLSKYATFEGVASRSEYWWWTLFYFLAVCVGLIISPVLYFVLMLGLLMPTLAVGVRRLHDIDKSGWWLLVSLIPIIGLIMIVWSLTPSKISSRWAQSSAVTP